jgi:hypothetical protein
MVFSTTPSKRQLLAAVFCQYSYMGKKVRMVSVWVLRCVCVFVPDDVQLEYEFVVSQMHVGRMLKLRGMLGSP